MTKINKWKAWVVVLIFISIISLLFAISVYSRQRRYIEEDKNQLMYEINNSIIKIKVKIDNIILDKEEIYIDYNDIENLMIDYYNLDRSIFGFKKKTRFADSKLDNGFQELWDNYNSMEPINNNDIWLYLEQLSKKADSKEDILLNDDDVYMLQEIYNFYNTMRKEIYNLFKYQR